MAQIGDSQENQNSSHRFRVTVEPQRVEQFDKVVSRNARNETRPTLRVPLTFPAIWYELSEVQSSIAEKASLSMGSAQFMLLHLEQTVEMIGKLEVAETYELNVQVGEVSSDKKLKVSAQVRNQQQVPLASMTSLFAVLSSQEDLS